MRKLCLTLVISFFALYFVSTASAANLKHRPFKDMTLREIESYQKEVIFQDRKIISWWNNHRPWPAIRFLAHVKILHHESEPYDLWWHKQQLVWTLRQLARTERKLAAVVRYSVNWDCIHHYEGSWTDSGAPYWGGLQMDWSFMKTYGWDVFPQLRGRTADRWTPAEQKMVAQYAVDHGKSLSSGWPNTSRLCGLT